MITRREVVLGGLLTLLYGIAPRCACAQATGLRKPHGRSCVLSDSEARRYLRNTRTEVRLYKNTIDNPIPSSGDRDFDLALAHALANISDAFEVLPGFAYCADDDGPNAYATREVRLQRTDGTVLFGKNFLRELMVRPENPEISVVAVCAHEFGHIVQFKHGLDRELQEGQNTAKCVELQADFLAGFFAGKRKLVQPNYPAAVFAATQFSFGDDMVDDPNHHGTPEQRGAAVVKGFELAYKQQRPLADALLFSSKYVLQL